jgi:type IV secretory pathway VirB10-like protein
MSIRMLPLAVFLSATLFLAPALVRAADAPSPAQPAAAPAAPPPAATENAPVFPKLMTVEEAARPPAARPQRQDEAAAQSSAQSLAMGQRIADAARSLRNMGMLTLSAVLGLLGSALAGGLLALFVSNLRERRAAVAGKAG